MKTFFKITICIFAIFLIIAVGGLFYLSAGLKDGSRVVINDIDPADFEDGTYKGEYKSGRWSNDVVVTIKDKKIVDIKVIDDVMAPKPEVTWEIIRRVIDSQSTEVEVVSSATVTSKAYLKSIENALKK